MENFISSTTKLFQYYKSLGEKAMAQVQPEQLFHSDKEDTNSIAVIVKHLHGNMLSRWTDFLTSDGEKPWRERDREFYPEDISKDELMQLWDDGWNCLFDALASLDDTMLDQIVYIRNEGHSVMEAVNRQLAHYSYHVGQIVYMSKLMKTSDWDSLSIPRNKSAGYNAEKFANEKRRSHFTDGEMKPKNP